MFQLYNDAPLYRTKRRKKISKKIDKRHQRKPEKQEREHVAS